MFGIKALSALLVLFTAVGMADAEVIFLEAGGVVVAEAEHFSSRTDGPTGHAWTLIDGPSGQIAPGEPDAGTTPPSGPYANPSGDYMQALPDEVEGGFNNGSYGGGDPFDSPLVNSPLLNFTVRITTTGEYRLFLRANGYDGNSDSIYGSLVEARDGSGGAADWYRVVTDDSANFQQPQNWFGSGAKEDDGSGSNSASMTWNITQPGDYTIQILMREDGAAIDKLAFQRSNLSTPSGLGPAESEIIPEPASLALLGAAALLCLPGRRKH